MTTWRGVNIVPGCIWILELIFFSVHIQATITILCIDLAHLYVLVLSHFQKLMLWVLHIVYRFESIFEFIWSGVSWLDKAWSTNILNRSLLSSINLVAKNFIGIWIVRANFQIIVILTPQSLVLPNFTVGCLINDADEITKKISLAHRQLTLSTIYVPSIRRIIVRRRRHPAEDSFLLLWIFY